MNADYKVGDLIYDANIYDGLNTFLSDLQFYKKWLPENKDDRRILELCCGTGRLTLPIAKDGYNICGVDYTSSMLEQAKAKASEAGLEINFIEADIRTLNLQEKFDFIFIPFNSIHHLYRNEDLFKALKRVESHLKEGGLFLLDCFNPNSIYCWRRKRTKSSCWIHNQRWKKSIDKTNNALWKRNPNKSYRMALFYKWWVSFNPKYGYEIVFSSRIRFISGMRWI